MPQAQDMPQFMQSYALEIKLAARRPVIDIPGFCIIEKDVGFHLFLGLAGIDITHGHRQGLAAVIVFRAVHLVAYFGMKVGAVAETVLGIAAYAGTGMGRIRGIHGKDEIRLGIPFFRGFAKGVIP